MQSIELYPLEPADPIMFSTLKLILRDLGTEILFRRVGKRIGVALQAAVSDRILPRTS